MHETSAKLDFVLLAMVTVALGGCAQPEKAPVAAAPIAPVAVTSTSPTTATSAVASASAAVAVPVASADPTAGFPAGARDLHVLGDGTRLALVKSAQGDDTIFVLPPGASAAKATFTSLDGKVTQHAWLDLDGDGVEEWVLWSGAKLTVLGSRRGQIVELDRLRWMLEGAKDEAAVRARTGRLRGYVAPAEGVTARDVLLSLQLATDDEVRALVDPKGVTVCDVRTGNAHPHSRVCHTLRGAAWTPTKIFDELLRVRAFADHAGQEFRLRDHDDGSWAPEPPQCTTNGDVTSCSANMGGPGEYVWEFRGKGASLKLHALESVVFEDS